MNKYKVSFVMGVYNDSNTIEETLDSIINQTYSNWELIVCDDGSKDNTLDILERYIKKHNNIKLLKNIENKGLAFSLNRCIDSSAGYYIARIDSDDVCMSNRLETQINAINESGYNFVGSNALYFDSNGVWGKSNVLLEVDRVNVYRGNAFIHPSILIEKTALLNVNKYTVSSETYRTEDYDLWCKLYNSGYKGFNLSEYLIKYRLNKNAYNKRKYKYRIDEFKLKIKWYKKMRLNKLNLIYAFKPLIVGIIPKDIMQIYHKNKFSR